MSSSIIIVILISLVLSAFFSGMEIAFTASNKLLLEIDKKQSRVYGYLISIFQNARARFLTTMLVGNNVALVIFSLYMSKLLYPHGPSNVLVETLVSTCTVIFTAEFLPKALVRSSPNFYLRIFIVPAYFFYLLFYVFSWFSTLLSSLMMRVFGLRVTGGALKDSFDRVDLQSLVEEEINSESPTDNEIKIFHNALDFSQIRIRQCMVPRVEITAFDIEDDIEQLRELFIRSKFSRIPIYRDSIDTIVGYASSRQLFESPSSVEEMVREPIYVPSSGLASALLGEFIRSRRSLAIVIDEFGSTAGMVTIEDILEEIFGEIDDEHDDQYLMEKELGDGAYLFSGRVEIEHINSVYEFDIATRDDYETLAGYLLYNVGEIPRAGEQFTFDGLNFVVERSTERRISLIRVQKMAVD